MASRTYGDTGPGPLNRERAERRRAVARTVREVRERLDTTTANGPAFDHEMVQTYAGYRLATAAAPPLIAAFFAATSLIWIPWTSALAWLAAVLVLHAVTILLGRGFLGQPGGADLGRVTARFVVAEFANGVAWTALVLLTLAPPWGEGVDVFRFALAILVIAGGAMMAATLPAAALAATLPMAAVAAAIFAAQGGAAFYAAAALIAASEIVFLLLARRFHRATLSALESRAEKDALIGELGTAKAVSDESLRRAEEANLAKSRFLATMSHELRTPLNAILGFSEVMKGEVLGPMHNASYREYAGDIHSSGQHLLNLINEILDLSRVEAGRYKLNEEPVDLAGLVEECRHLVHLKARGKQLTVAERVEDDLPRIWADPRAVRQVVLNLLSNAVKFTQPGGRIEMRVGWSAEGGQYVSVSDNGPGIPEEEMPIVLSAFGQGSLALRTAEDGTGLGLPIVQALMATHDGSFELTSRVGQGTVATITFPRSRVMEALPPVDEGSRVRWRRAS